MSSEGKDILFVSGLRASTTVCCFFSFLVLNYQDMDLFALEGMDIWRLLAGLGIFLFGMFLLEEGVQALSGQAFQRLLQRFTNNPLKAVLTGTLATAVLQSSSAVSLMVLAFVGAGVLGMGNAIGVVVGSNLGTTATAWIVATIGFKLDLEAFALPFIGLGGLGLIFLGKRPRYAAFSRLLSGFGFLFMGLDFMKDAVETYTAHMGPDFFQGVPVWLYLIIGIVLTAITQSSSASMAMILSAVHAGMASLDAAALFVIGANMGTTFTVMLGALGGTVVKKRVALSHVLFNWITGLIALAVLPLLMRLLDVLQPGQDDPVVSLAIFHSIFNGMGVLLFLPFTGVLGRLVLRLLPERESAITRYISRIPARVGQAAAEALRKESWHLFTRVLDYHHRVLGVEEPAVSPLPEEAGVAPGQEPEGYKGLKAISKAMHDFAGQLQEESLSGEQGDMVNRALFAARMALFSAKWMRDLRDDLREWEAAASDRVALRQSLQQRQHVMVDHLRRYFTHPVDHQVAYDQLKEELKRLDRESESAFTQGQGPEAHRNGLDLARLLTINKTWYLAWRNHLLALRELDLEIAESEEM